MGAVLVGAVLVGAGLVGAGAFDGVTLGAASAAPAVFAGAGLAAFSAGLIGLYLRTPGMRQEGSLRPTEQGIALSKDIWLLGIGVSLIADGVLEDENS